MGLGRWRCALRASRLALSRSSDSALSLYALALASLLYRAHDHNIIDDSPLIRPAKAFLFMRRGVGMGEPTEKASNLCQAQTTNNARQCGDGRREGEIPKE